MATKKTGSRKSHVGNKKKGPRRLSKTIGKKARSGDKATAGTSKSLRKRKLKAKTGPILSRDAEIPPNKTFPIVGMGASAGGLEAFTALLNALPADTGMAFVLVQHMAPTHESLLNRILEKATTMQVSQVTDGMRVEPNHVYVIPPNSTMSIHKKVLRLVARIEGTAKHLPIDHFFCALAEDQKSSAIGVILSGSASDGTQGLKAIQAEGGIAFAQDEASAKYTGMPLSAVAAGCVDLVLSPEEIANKLAHMAHNPFIHPTPNLPDSTVLPEDDGSLYGFRA